MGVLLLGAACLTPIVPSLLHLLWQPVRFHLFLLLLALAAGYALGRKK